MSINIEKYIMSIAREVSKLSGETTSMSFEMSRISEIWSRVAVFQSIMETAHLLAWYWKSSAEYWTISQLAASSSSFISFK